MANRHYEQFQNSLEKKLVNIFINFDGNSTSTPILKSWNPVTAALVTAPSTGYRGVTSITRNGTGDFTFKFQDNYVRLLDVSLNPLAIDGSTTPLAVGFWIKAINPTAAGGATVRVITYLATPGTPVDPGTNDRWYGQFTWSDSAAP